jgi:hypothetical protein
MGLHSAPMQARAGMAGGPSRPDLLLMEGCWPVFLHRGLASSRALERFRNQVPSGLVCRCQPGNASSLNATALRGGFIALP